MAVGHFEATVVEVADVEVRGLGLVGDDVGHVLVVWGVDETRVDTDAGKITQYKVNLMVTFARDATQKGPR